MMPTLSRNLLPIQLNMEMRSEELRSSSSNGTVIAQNRGHNAVDGSFVVRRVVAGEGVERTFPIHSPKVVKVEVTRRGRVRRAKLFYLRDRVGKAATTLRERR